jgi:hypothetical protein
VAMSGASVQVLRYFNYYLIVRDIPMSARSTQQAILTTDSTILNIVISGNYA